VDAERCFSTLKLMPTEIHHTVIPEEKHCDKASYSWEEKEKTKNVETDHQ
jgi:hypothetical protein